MRPDTFAQTKRQTHFSLAARRRTIHSQSAVIGPHAPNRCSDEPSCELPDQWQTQSLSSCRLKHRHEPTYKQEEESPFRHLVQSAKIDEMKRSEKSEEDEALKAVKPNEWLLSFAAHEE